jgi:hypothetical protein
VKERKERNEEIQTHFNPTTTLTPPSFNHPLAISSAPAGIVADKKHFWIFSLVQASTIGVIWGKKSDERSRSDSSSVKRVVLVVSFVQTITSCLNLPDTTRHV